MLRIIQTNFVHFYVITFKDIIFKQLMATSIVAIVIIILAITPSLFIFSFVNSSIHP
jgi:hypothetical protein